MSDESRIREILDLVKPEEITEMLRAVNLFAQAGTMSDAEAQAWRDAILMRFLQVSDEEIRA
jgi:hypothetical protein